MKIFTLYSELVDIKKSKPNPQNPNKHPERQIKILSEIIKKQGWRTAITVSKKSGYIVRGHARFESAKRLGLEKVPVEYQEYATEQIELADMIADNKISEMAYTDDEILKEILLKLDDGEFDMEITGYDLEELENMLTVDITENIVSENNISALHEQPEKDMHIKQQNNNNYETNHIRPGESDTKFDKGTSKNENWFYITYYEDTNKYEELKKIIKDMDGMKTEHEILPIFFEGLLKNVK